MCQPLMDELWESNDSFNGHNFVEFQLVPDNVGSCKWLASGKAGNRWAKYKGLAVNSVKTVKQQALEKSQ